MKHIDPKRRPKRGRRVATKVLCMAVPLCALSQAFAAELTATWVGSANNGNYSTAANWDIDQVPLNNAGTTYIVEIGAGKGNVGYNVAGAQTIDQFSLDTGSAFNLTSGSAINPSNLTVLGQALIAGTISAVDASFTALGSGTGFLGTTNTVSATQGGVVSIGATSFNASGLGNSTILNASGTGSMIDLSSVQTLNVGEGSAYNDAINATSGGKVKLSGVTSLIAPATGVALVFTGTGGGNIDLSSLQTLGGVTTDSGYTSFSLDASSATIGPLQKANRLNVSLQNAATMTIGGYAGAANVTNSTFAAASGSVLDASRLVGTLAERGLGNTVLLSASGSGTVLDFSGLQTLDVGQGSAYNDAINATGGARIDLSGVTTLIAPASGVALVFTANGGSTFDLSSLQTVGGVTTDSGYTNFSLDASSAKIGPLQSANRLNVSLQNGSTMTIGGFSGAANVTNSTFSVAGASVLDASKLKGTLAERGLGNATLLGASGSGSVLNLSGLQTLDIGQGSAYGDAIAASASGRIDLSGVTTLLAPLAANVPITFTASSGGSISLASLQTISNATGGLVNFNVATGGSLLLHGLNAGPGVHFTLTDAGSLLTVTGSLGLLSGSTLAAGAGTTVAVAGNYSFQQTVESQVDTDLATLAIGVAGLHTVEVGGKALGLPTGTTVVSGNFALGQLDVGQAATANVVELVDAVDNGNRGSSHEVLYLNGVGGTGLHILGGSTLVLDGLDLYATQNGQWVHINDLFQNGVTRIAYDQGFIVNDVSAVPEPGPWMLVAAGLGVIGWRRRVTTTARRD